MKTAFPVALMIPHFLWNTNALQNSKVALPVSSLSVLKWYGTMINPLNVLIANVVAAIRVPVPNAAAWYIYPEKDLRAYPGTIRGTNEWNNTYKIRTAVERDINHIKENLCLAGRRTQNEKTLHADLILAGITQLITVVLADKINHPEYIRSLKPLIA